MFKGRNESSCDGVNTYMREEGEKKITAGVPKVGAPVILGRYGVAAFGLWLGKICPALLDLCICPVSLQVNHARLCLVPSPGGGGKSKLFTYHRQWKDSQSNAMRLKVQSGPEDRRRPDMRSLSGELKTGGRVCLSPLRKRRLHPAQKGVPGIYTRRRLRQQVQTLGFT